MKRPEVLARGVYGIRYTAGDLKVRHFTAGPKYQVDDVDAVLIDAAAFDAYCAEVEQRIAAAVAQEREAILTLGEKFDYDEKDEYTQAIRSRGAEEGK